MLAGKKYDQQDQQLSDEKLRARLLIMELNDTREDQKIQRARILKELIPYASEELWLQTPFYCDNGSNMVLGLKVFFSFNCVVLDVMQVSIGSRTMFGPNVQVYSATHPIYHQERASGREFAKPITIGEYVWVGGSAVRQFNKDYKIRLILLYNSFRIFHP